MADLPVIREEFPYNAKNALLRTAYRCCWLIREADFTHGREGFPHTLMKQWFHSELGTSHGALKADRQHRQLRAGCGRERRRQRPQHLHTAKNDFPGGKL